MRVVGFLVRELDHSGTISAKTGYLYRSTRPIYVRIDDMCMWFVGDFLLYYCFVVNAPDIGTLCVSHYTQRYTQMPV